MRAAVSDDGRKVLFKYNRQLYLWTTSPQQRTQTGAWYCFPDHLKVAELVDVHFVCTTVSAIVYIPQHSLVIIYRRLATNYI